MPNKSDLDDHIDDHEARIRNLEYVANKILNDLNWIKIICGGILTSIVIPVALRHLGIQ